MTILIFDQLQMYSVDHPEGTVAGVTESGDIVIYDASYVGSTEYATLNRTSQITELIQYNYSGPKIVKGVNSDSIYAQYDTLAQNKTLKRFKSNRKIKDGLTYTDSLALIGNIGHNPDYDYPGGGKTWAGVADIFLEDGEAERQFARRELSSEVIIPFGNIDDIVEYVDVSFANDYEVTYFSVVPVSYYGYTQTALTLISAEHSEAGDISSALESKDYEYAYLDTTGIIILQFQDETTPEEGMIRDYVIEVNGHYTVSDRGSYALLNNQFIKESSQKTENPYIFKLNSNYPNPFNPNTTIKYSIPKDANTTLNVYNALGQLVTTLVNVYQQAGMYEVNFNGANYPSGVYFYRLESGNFVETKKMVLIK